MGKLNFIMMDFFSDYLAFLSKSFTSCPFLYFPSDLMSLSKEALLIKALQLIMEKIIFLFSSSAEFRFSA